MNGMEKDWRDEVKWSGGIPLWEGQRAACGLACNIMNRRWQN